MRAHRLCEGVYICLWLQIRRFSGELRTVNYRRIVFAKSKHDAIMKTIDEQIAQEKQP